jgi:hypothetical protein
MTTTHPVMKLTRGQWITFNQCSIPMEILDFGHVARGRAVKSELMVLCRPRGCHSQIWKKASDIVMETPGEK